MINEGLVNYHGNYLFVIQEKLEIGNWLISNSGYLVRVNTPTYRDTKNKDMFNNSYVTVRKVIGHSGIGGLEKEPLVKFANLNNDWENPDLVIIKK